MSVAAEMGVCGERAGVIVSDGGGVGGRSQGAVSAATEMGECGERAGVIVLDGCGVWGAGVEGRSECSYRDG